MEGLNDSINAWYNKHGVDKSILIKLKYKVIGKTDEKIEIQSNNTSGKYWRVSTEGTIACTCKIHWLLIANLQCSVKPLSKAVNAVLKLMYKQMETYNSKSYYFSGIKSSWPGQNNQPVTDALSKLNVRNKALSIPTYDFCTHYINMPHNKLKHVMRKLTSFVSMMVKTVLTKFGATQNDDRQ